jgi:hypothetical protein
MSDIGAAIAALGPRDYCPCGSGKRLERCCLRGRFFRPPVANVNPPGTRTNYAHAGCYLSAVDDNCSQNLSREHFVSKSILEVLDVAGGSRGVFMEGLPWLKGRKALPPDALASKILCERHNNALSPLDDAALRFFRCLMDLPRLLSTPGRKMHRLYMFSGIDLERWMIKLLAGLLVSGNATCDGKKKVVEALPRWWLEVLLGRKVLPPEIGLGTMEIVGRPPQNVPDSIAFAPLFYSESGVEEPAGATVWLRGLAFGLVLVNVPNKVGTWVEHFLHHASLTKFVAATGSVTIFLAGEGWDMERGTTLNWSPDPVE